MAKYIELDAAIALIREQGIYGEGHSDEERENDVISMLESVTTADVTEVVRCRDCKRYRKEKAMDVFHPNGFVRFCSMSRIETRPDDFCSCAERKEG